MYVWELFGSLQAEKEKLYTMCPLDFIAFYRIHLCQNTFFLKRFEKSSQLGFLRDFFRNKLRKVSPPRFHGSSAWAYPIPVFKPAWYPLKLFIPLGKFYTSESTGSDWCVCFLYFVFQNCCHIRCVGARAGTEFSKSLDQTHMCFFMVCYPPCWFWSVTISQMSYCCV